MRVPHNSFVMVADGRKSLFFRNEGDAQALNLQVVNVRAQENPADHEHKTDTAGQAPSDVGGHGATMGETDYHQQAEDRFAADTANLLRTRALAGDYEQLIVVAPPKTLGELRKHYHKAVEQRLCGEIAKDLTGHPVPEIERILAAEGG